MFALEELTAGVTIQDGGGGEPLGAAWKQGGKLTGDGGKPNWNRVIDEAKFLSGLTVWVSLYT